MKASRYRGLIGPRRPRVASTILDSGLLVFGVLMLLPLLWALSTSFASPHEAFTYPPKWVPTHPTLENYQAVFDRIPFLQMFLNSVVVSIAITVGSLGVSALAAYAFSRVPFRGSRLTFVGMLGALMVPGQLTVIPVFVLLRNLGLVDTLAALIIPALINVFQIFFLVQYFNSIPRELDDAARLDGAGHLRILFSILIPNSWPAISALGILSLEATWNAYFGPLIFLYSRENMTLPLGLVTLQSGLGPAPSTIVFAGVLLSIVPMVVLYLVFQRGFTSSLATTGIRG
jgi:multiple sugar transport system permease protein